MNIKKIILLCHVLMTIWIAHSAPLRNVPMVLMQPDSTQISCYASGDEFFHWLHNGLGNIIIQDTISGYYCYHIDDSDSLVVARNESDASNRYSKNPYQFRNEHNSFFEINNREERHPYRFSPSRTSVPRTINNIVVLVTFLDQSDYNVSERNYISIKFCDSTSTANSLKNYYWESSYHQLRVNSTLYPSGTSVYSYQDGHEREHYCLRSVTHPNGYSNDNERKDRERTLIINAVNSIKSQIPSTLNLDTDNDGLVDNVCLIIKGGPEGWDDLLWPHHSVLPNGNSVDINGKRVGDYNFHLYNTLAPDSGSTGVICHEFGHTLGMPDLYHYNEDPNTHQKWQPVGQWDLMAADCSHPQQTSGYMKWKYLQWINTIPEITQCGHYTLSPISSSAQCYKINLNGSNEFLYLEYRDKTQTYDSWIPNSGLLVYRINTTKHGNGDAVLCGGGDDEVYVYRPDGNFSNDGDLSNAPFCVELEATKFNESTNPQEFLSNGATGNVYIYNVSECGSTISFDVRFRTYNNVTYNQNSTIPSVTNAETITTTGNVVINNNTTFKATEGIRLNAGFEVSNGTSFQADVNPCE